MSESLTTAEALQRLRAALQAFEAQKKSTINHSSEGTPMSHARMRVTLDIPCDPATASPRSIQALAEEAKNYVQVVLVKDREITLSDHVEVIDTHVHRSTESEACEHCVRKLAMDERQ